MNMNFNVKSEWIRVILIAIILSAILFISMGISGNWILTYFFPALILYFFIGMLITALFIRKQSILIPISIGVLAGILFYSYMFFYISIISEPNGYIGWGLIWGISFIFGIIWLFSSAMGMILSNYIKKSMEKKKLASH